MRMTEEASSKTAMASQSSAASTPMPTTPATPTVASFPVGETSALYPSEHAFEPGLFTRPELAFGTSEPSFGTIGAPDKQPPADITIDPELLAISQDPSYLQVASDDLQNFDINLEELFGALPVPNLDSSTNPIGGAAEALDLTGFPSWDEHIPLDTFFNAWFPVPAQPVPTVPLSQPAAASSQAAATLSQSSFGSAAQSIKRGSKQQDLPPGSIRIPPRTEALALLERARARKTELEAKIKNARRQAWACMVEAGVEQNLLRKLRESRISSGVDDLWHQVWSSRWYFSLFLYSMVGLVS
jgi:hypothetical protein